MDVMWSTVTSCTCIRARRVLLRFSKTDYSQCGGPTSKGERRESRESWESRQQQSWRFESQMDPTGRGSIFWFVPMRSAQNQATYSSSRCKLKFITVLVLLSQAWHWPKAQDVSTHVLADFICMDGIIGSWRVPRSDHVELKWVEQMWVRRARIKDNTVKLSGNHIEVSKSEILIWRESSFRNLMRWLTLSHVPCWMNLGRVVTMSQHSSVINCYHVKVG